MYAPYLSTSPHCLSTVVNIASGQGTKEFSDSKKAVRNYYGANVFALGNIVSKSRQGDMVQLNTELKTRFNEQLTARGLRAYFSALLFRCLTLNDYNLSSC